MYRLLRVAAVVSLFTPYVLGTADRAVDQSMLAVVMFFALTGYAEALKKDDRIDRLEQALRRMRQQGTNLRQGARVEDFRDVFR